MIEHTRRSALKLAGLAAGVTLGGVGVTSANGGASDTAPGRTASVRFTNQTVSGEIDTVDIAAAFLPEGGYVILHDVADNEVGIGKPVGATGYLHPGMNRNVTADVTGSQYGGNLPNPETTQSLVAMAHMDEPGDRELTFPNGDPPYTQAGAPVIDIGVVAVK